MVNRSAVRTLAAHDLVMKPARPASRNVLGLVNTKEIATCPALHHATDSRVTSAVCLSYLVDTNVQAFVAKIALKNTANSAPFKPTRVWICSR